MTAQNSTYRQYKPALFFILKFALLYVLLVLLYNAFLSFYKDVADPVTVFTGKAVTRLFELFGAQAQSLPLESENGLKLILNGEYVARIVEGCNSLSVIIMFVAFVLSFGKKIKKSILFALVGSLLIFVFNIIRIVILGHILYRFPEYQDIAHRVIFPAMIYGFVVLLWIVFVKKFSDA